MARTKKTKVEQQVDDFARKQYQQLRDEQVPVYIADAEREAYYNKRFAQEVSKFDANYFRAMTSGEDAPLSTSRLAQPEQMRREAEKLRASIAGTGASRAMWFGMMCLTPMFREGLSFDSIATIGGMLTVMGIGALVNMPDTLAKARNKREINKEVNQLNKQAVAKKYDKWCRNMERKIASGDSNLVSFMGRERSAKFLDIMQQRRDSAAKKAGVRIGMSEESVGIAGVGILVAANKQMREHPDQAPSVNRVYQENMATLYRMAAEDGMTRESVQASIGRAYARVVDGIIQTEGEDCYNNPDSSIHDFATGNGVKPPEMQISAIEGGSKEFIVSHKDGCVPYAKKAYSVTEREFVGDMKPFVVPTLQQSVNASRAIIKNIGNEFSTIDKEAQFRGCSVATVRTERFDTFNSYIESALDESVNPYTEDANNLAGALYSYNRMPDEYKNDEALYNGIGRAYVDVCKDNVMTPAEYDKSLNTILTGFQDDIANALRGCKDISDIEHVHEQVMDVANVLKYGMVSQYAEPNPFMDTAQALYDLQKEAGRAFEMNTLAKVTGNNVMTAEHLACYSGALYSTLADLESYSFWPKEAKKRVIEMCDKTINTPGATPDLLGYAQEMKTAVSTPFISLYQQFNGAMCSLNYDIPVAGYNIDSYGDKAFVQTFVRSRDVDGEFKYNPLKFEVPLPDSPVLDRLGVDRNMTVTTPQYRPDGPVMESRNNARSRQSEANHAAQNNIRGDANVSYTTDDSACADIIDMDAEVEAPVSVDLSLVDASLENEEGKGSDDMEMGE